VGTRKDDPTSETAWQETPVASASVIRETDRLGCGEAGLFSLDQSCLVREMVQRANPDFSVPVYNTLTPDIRQQADL
jgi:hypothetical protein